ncbi:MAG: hypothetical protein JNM07_07150 [Phycisphaerae bacterium]|nr:hypothetical protein [Phycisphaerae bacterium]
MKNLNGNPVRRAEGEGRRGSVLVLVVGVLALLAIIAVVYSAIGQADRRGSAAVARAKKLDDKAREVADYLAGVVGRDALALRYDYEKTDATGNKIPVVRREATDYPSTDPAMRSRPVAAAGSAAWRQQRFNPEGSAFEKWAVSPGDPRVPSDPFLASTEPTWLGTSADASSGQAKDSFTNLHDWAHISNFAPDGRFVNLSQLRKHGYDATYDQMHEAGSLKLFGPTGNPGYGQLDDNSTPADENIPSHFDSRQRWAYRPINDTRNGPASALWLPYSWADADGDGMADARWFELVDGSDQTAIRELLGMDQGLRLFIAVRAIDLSGLVNVNSALLFSGEGIPTAQLTPTDALPVGLSSAEVDFRRLLSGRDFYDAYTVWYESYLQPAGNGPSNYKNLTRAIAGGVGRSAFNAYLTTLLSGKMPAGAVAGDATGIPKVLGPTNAAGQPLWDFNDQAWSPSKRVQIYDYFGVSPGAGVSTDETNPAAPVASLAGFGLDDEIELRTYNGVNDPARTSRLERVLGGRDATNPIYSPLRDNRPLELEREGRNINRNGSTAAPGLPGEIALLQSATDVRRLITTVNGAAPRLSSVVTPPAAPNDPPPPLSLTEERTDLVSIVENIAQSQTATPADVSRLFNTCADALLPYSEEQNAWQYTAPKYPLGYLAYGNDPELALRLAAHTAINLSDMYDGQGDTSFEPGAFTLVARVGADTGTTPQFPWPRLKLPDARLAPSGVALQNSMVNVYGVEPQPFLTEVAAYAVFWDSPMRDNEWTDHGGVPPAPITIDFAVNEGNPDFLMEVLAFQLYNPFSVTLELSGPNGQLRYYIEYAGRFYALAQVNESTGNIDTSVPVRIPPRETRVFYTMTQATKPQVQARWNAAGTDVAPDFVDKWVRKQLATPAGFNFVDPVHIPMVSPVDGSVQGPTTAGGFNLYDLVGDFYVPPPGETKDRHAVYLWRAMYSGQTGDTPGTNSLFSDVLVDRLRDPTSQGSNPLLRLRRDPGSPPQLKTEISDAFILTGTGNEEDTGYAITLSAVLGRPDGGGATYSIGTLPPWCVERKSGDPDAQYAALNGGVQTPANIVNKTSWVQADFAASFGYKTIAGLAAGQTSGQPLQPRMTTKMESKNGRPMPVNLTGKSYASVMAQLPRADGDSTQFHRVSDLLLPVCVGPSFEQKGGSTSRSKRENSWMTLGESLALALDYDRVPSGRSSKVPTNPRSMYYLFSGDGTATNLPKTERGALVTDDYVPFFDADNDGLYDPAKGDRPRGDGVPLALSLLSATRSVAFGGLNSRVSGVVNINTAPLSVLRLLPLLSPSSDPSAWTATGPLSAQQNAGSDIASTILAYRDKTAVLPRGAGANQYLDFRDTTANTFRGRFNAAAVPNLRETPGFASVGELAVVRDGKWPGNGNTAYREAHNFDRLGIDTQNLSVLGVERGVRNDSGTYQADPVADNPGERLALADAVLNSVTVRSDVYCVWFVVHGYTRADVEGIDQSEPLLPSVQRRYVMVLDRSNVKNPGDRPRVLMLREVPM